MVTYWILFFFVVIWMGLIAIQENDEFGRIEILRFSTRWLFVIVLSLFVGMFSDIGSLDYENYVDLLKDTPPVTEWKSEFLKDPFFQALGMMFANSDGSLTVLTFVTTFLSLGIKMSVLSGKYYKNVFVLAMLFLIGRFFLLHEFTQLRASLGIAFITLSVVSAMEKRWFLLIFSLIIAAFTHLSTIALLPLVLLICQIIAKVKLVFLLFTVLAFSILGVIFKDEIFFRLAPYLTGDYLVTENTVVSFYFIFKTLVLLTLLFQWKSLSPSMRCALMASVYGLFLTLAFLQNNVLSLRFGELTAVFDCICFAYFLKYSFKLESSYAYSAGLVIAALLYFSSTKIVNSVSLTF